MSVTLGLMHFAFVRQWRFSKKGWLIWLIFCVCVCVPKFVYYWMLVCLHMCCCLHIHIYIRLCVYWLAFLHIYTYFHYLLLGRGETKEGSVRKDELVRRGGKWIVAIRMISFSSIILPNFMVAKGLFDVNMKCLFCREFCWVMMMMIKIKIIIMLLFLIYNHCVVKGYEV